MKVLSNGQVQIKNLLTGEERVIDPSEIGSYGISPDLYNAAKQQMESTTFKPSGNYQNDIARFGADAGTRGQIDAYYNPPKTTPSTPIAPPALPNPTLPPSKFDPTKIVFKEDTVAVNPTRNITNNVSSPNPEQKVRDNNWLLNLGKAIFAPPIRFGQGLAKSITSNIDQKNVQSSLENDEEVMNKNMQLALKLKAQGNMLGYQKLLDENAKISQRNQKMTNANLKKTNVEAEKGKEDLLKGGVGTASYFVPGGGYKTAAVSGGMFGYGISEKGKELPAIAGGIAGGLIAKGTMDLGSKAVSSLFKGVPTRIMNSIFKETGKRAKMGDKSLGSEVLKKGEVGTDGKFYSRALEKIQALEDDLQARLFNSDKKVDTAKIRESLQPQIDKLRDSGNIQAADFIEQRITNIENQAGTAIPVARANEIKRALYDELRGSYGAESTANKELLKRLAKSFKDQIGLEKGIDNINKDLSYYGRVADVLEKKIIQEQGKAGLSLIDTIIGGAGLISGAVTPAVAAIGAKHALGSTLVKTAGAQGIDKAGKAGAKLLESTVGKAGSSMFNFALPQIGKYAGATAGNSFGQLPSISASQETNENESEQYNPDHILPSITNTAVQSTTPKQKYATGYSKEDWYREAQKAMYENPPNQTAYDYYMDMAKEEAASEKDNKTPGESTNEILNITDKLLARDTKPITGALRAGSMIPGGSGKYTQALYEQLKGLLSLESRQKLKGQGQISDYEFKVLEQSASALRDDMSDEDFKAVLEELKLRLQNNPTQ